MVLFSNSPPASGQIGINHAYGVTNGVTDLQNRLSSAHECASAQFFDFLELAENCAFLDRKLISTLNETVDGHEIVSVLRSMG